MEDESGGEKDRARKGNKNIAFKNQLTFSLCNFDPTFSVNLEINIEKRVIKRRMQ